MDRSRSVIESAIDNAGSGGPEFLEWPMERVGELQFRPDAAICMWQSFGYFSSSVNGDILSQFGSMLPSGGRLVMDLYHRGFFQTRLGTRTTRVDEMDL